MALDRAVQVVVHLQEPGQLGVGYILSDDGIPRPTGSGGFSCRAGLPGWTYEGIRDQQLLLGEVGLSDRLPSTRKIGFEHLRPSIGVEAKVGHHLDVRTLLPGQSGEVSIDEPLLVPGAHHLEEVFPVLSDYVERGLSIYLHVVHVVGKPEHARPTEEVRRLLAEQQRDGVISSVTVEILIPKSGEYLYHIVVLVLVGRPKPATGVFRLYVLRIRRLHADFSSQS